MNVHQGLSQRVAALVDRLQEAGTALREPVPVEENPRMKRLHDLSRHVAHIREQGERMDTALADFLPPLEGEGPASISPRQFTWRTRRLLLHGRDLLEQLKALAGELPLSPPYEGGDRGGQDPSDNLPVTYRQAVAMIGMVLRSVQSFPDSAAEQLSLCDGLEGLLRLIETQVIAIQAMIDRRRAENERVESLAQLFNGLVNNRPVLWKPFPELAEELANEARGGLPLRMMQGNIDRPEHFAAAHGLNVARLMARVSRRDLGWRGRPLDPILAALVFDAGMAAMPADLLCHRGALHVSQRRQVEAHVGLSASIVNRLVPEEGWLIDVVRAHHERLDGTGYPAGAQGAQIPRMARLLAACDTYVALVTPRGHRRGLNPRAALTETLLEAEKGRLDLELAEYLLEISFYPVGSVVELSDGHMGIVVATNHCPEDVNNASRPVIQLLTAEGGKPLPWPQHVNLAQCEGRHIVRSLASDEARTMLGNRYWQLME